VRARLVAAADGELRTIERALHDGVQQDLIAVSVLVQLARRLAVTDGPAAIAVLDEIGREVRDALHRVANLANEIYPSVLEARGLPDALLGAASARGVAAKIDAAGGGRYPVEVEAAVYFFWRAALDAVAVPAAADARVTIRIVEEDHALRVVIDYETARLDLASDALSSVRDRIESLGGVLAFEPATGGTRLTATVPLP
jgi:signal transduction histidine kinase